MRVQLPPSAPLVASSDIDLTREGGPRFVVIAGLWESRRQLRALHILQDNKIMVASGGRQLVIRTVSVG